MSDEIKGLLKELLKENLTVKFETEPDYDYDRLRVTILFDGEEIDSDSVYTSEGLIKW